MRIHFIGCLGVSMRELMQLQRDRLNTVTGSDINLCGHKAENVHGADLVVYTNAVGENNVELVEARRLKIPAIERAQMLGQLAATYGSVTAVAGAHGKTTATGMCAAAMQSLSPTVHIGGDLNPIKRVCPPSNVGKSFFVTEACEYRRSFLELKPAVGAVLNVDLDHTDYYRDFADILSAYDAFASRCKMLLVNSDDRASMYLDGKDKYMFGLNSLAYFRGRNLSCEKGNCYSFDFYIDGAKACRARLFQPGFHNVYNALCALSAATLNGIAPAVAARSLESFAGVKRRFERVGSLCGATVITDYAHHPKEIRATLLNARKCGRGRLYAVFQPHTYTRTQSLQSGFAKSLSEADTALILPIYPAREQPVKGVSAHGIALAMQQSGRHAVYTDTFFGVKDYLLHNLDPCDTVVFLGAGDVDLLARSCVDGV